MPRLAPVINATLSRIDVRMCVLSLSSRNFVYGNGDRSGGATKKHQS
jgi:hypothetical protein